MAIDSASTWGQNIADAIQQIGVVAGTPVTVEQLRQLWTVVKTEDKAQLAKADVAPGTFTAPGGGGTVTGIGGPVS